MFRTHLGRWLDRAFRTNHKAAPTRRSRPMLELLERRDAPAVYRVTGTSDGAGVFQGGAGTAANPFRWTTLRGALDDVNVNHAAEANTIRLTAGLTYQVTLDQLTADLAGGSLDLRAVGKGRATLRAIQPEEGDPFRVLEVGEETTAVLRSLVLTGGRVDADGSPFDGGGGILNHGSLSLVKSVVAGNQAFDSESKFAQGGGIANFGALTLNRSVVRNNAVLEAPGEEPEPLFAGFGGGIANLGSLSLVKRSVVAGNSVTSKFAAGGGISLVPFESEPSVTSLSLSRSTVSGNVAQGVASDDSETSKFSSIALGGGIFDAGEAAIDIRNSTIANNLAHGGDAFESGQSETDFDSAGWASGGGLASGIFFGPDSSSNIHIIGSTFSGNRAVGGDSDFVQGGSAFGGGLSVLAPEALLMINSTLSGNVAQGGTGDDGEFCCGPSAAGGGLFFAGQVLRLDEVQTQQTPVVEGAHLVNVTVTQNLALAPGSDDEQQEGSPAIGGGIASEGGVIALWNTIVAQNYIDPGHNENLEGSDVFGDFVSTGVLSGHNLIGNADGSTGLGAPGSGDIVGTAGSVRNARLAPLANNGGPTQTHALRTNSPALDAGDDAVLGDPFHLATDQRGQPRKSGKRVDIGAFEVQVGGTRNRRWNR